MYYINITIEGKTIELLYNTFHDRQRYLDTIYDATHQTIDFLVRNGLSFDQKHEDVKQIPENQYRNEAYILGYFQGLAYAYQYESQNNYKYTGQYWIYRVMNWFG
jgi:hypothetical protein